MLHQQRVSLTTAERTTNHLYINPITKNYFGDQQIDTGNRNHNDGENQLHSCYNVAFGFVSAFPNYVN